MGRRIAAVNQSHSVTRRMPPCGKVSAHRTIALASIPAGFMPRIIPPRQGRPLSSKPKVSVNARMLRRLSRAAFITTRQPTEIKYCSILKARRYKTKGHSRHVYQATDHLRRFLSDGLESLILWGRIKCPHLPVSPANCANSKVSCPFPASHPKRGRLLKACRNKGVGKGKNVFKQHDKVV